MRRLLTLVALTSILGCKSPAPPPKVCEPPPPEPARVSVGTCPVDWSSDAAVSDVGDATNDGHP